MARAVTAVQWIRVTWGGWVLGVPCVIVLALLGEAAGIGGAQWLVGAGMGAGVGLMQARALRPVLSRPALWFAASTGGLALPFATSDALRVIGPHPTYSLLWCVLLGGALVGVLQAALLRSALRQPGWWILASVAGWALAAAAAAGADAQFRSHRLAGIVGALAYLGLIAIGGLAVGLLTAPLAVRLQPVIGPEGKR